MSIEIIKGYLPSETTSNLLGFPTYHRWDTSLMAAVGTIAWAVENAGIEKETAIVIADGSSEKVTDETRAANLNNYFGRIIGVLPDAVYILTQQTQRQVVDELANRLPHLSRQDIGSVILDTTCAGGRFKLTVLGGAYVVGTNRRIVIGFFDDDIRVRRTFQQALGFGDKPNSQVIFNSDQYPDFPYVELPNGSIKDFLSIPGKNLQELRAIYPNTPATKTRIDTMNNQLVVAQRNGSAVFEVNPSGESVPEATVWGVSAIKHKRPDYRSFDIAKTTLLEEFPDHELPLESFPAGPDSVFAFQTTDTSVDCAVSAWFIDDTTWRLPFSYIGSIEISRLNPFKTVDINSRADNEMLLTLLQKVEEETGIPLVYVTGVDFHAEHLREPSGYRPNIIEQACSALIDIPYAEAAVELMHFKDRFASMDEKAINAWSMPEERARDIFGRLHDLARISRSKIRELLQRNTHSTQEEGQVKTNIQRYQEVYQLIKGKLGVAYYEEKGGEEIDFERWADVVYQLWKDEIDKTGRQQLHHFNGVLKNTPIITWESQDMIRKGRYPVAMVALESNPTVSYPGSPTQPLNP